MEFLKYNDFVNEESINEAKSEPIVELLKIGSSITIMKGEKKLVELSDAFEAIGDEQAERIVNHLNMAIELVKAGESRSAGTHMSKFNKECQKELKLMKKQGLVESVNEAADYSELSISDIASIVYDDWKKVDRYAAPYLDAMLDLENITDRYFMDSGVSIVAYFLSNARTWKGSVAKDVKKELNKRLKNPR